MKIESTALRMWSSVSTSNDRPGNESGLSFEDILSKRKMNSADIAVREVHFESRPVTLVRFNNRGGFYRLAEVSDNEVVEVEISDTEKKRLSLLEELLEQLTGKNVRLHVRKRNDLEELGRISFISRKVRFADTGGNAAAFTSAGDGRKSDMVTFLSSGIINTADGRKIDFNLNLSLNKDLIETNHITFDTSRQAIDPLILNFAADSTELSGTEINFDIDVDGAQETITFPGAGSGFLTIDLNDDGIVNDGSELFGPKSGDGFKDLAAYDSDENRWIDENDSVFQRLKIWTKDTEGRDFLTTLSANNIGAIFLGSVSTEYEAIETHATVKKTGVFLRENGTAGTVQDIDYMI